MGVEGESSISSVKDSQLYSLVLLHPNKGVAKCEGKGTSVQEKDIGLALRRVVLPVHLLLNLAGVFVVFHNTVQLAIDIRIDERVLPLVAFLDGRLG